MMRYDACPTSSGSTDNPYKLHKCSDHPSTGWHFGGEIYTSFIFVHYFLFYGVFYCENMLKSL